VHQRGGGPRAGCTAGVAFLGLMSDYIHIIINNMRIVWAFKFNVFLAIFILQFMNARIL